MERSKPSCLPRPRIPVQSGQSTQNAVLRTAALRRRSKSVSDLRATATQFIRKPLRTIVDRPVSANIIKRKGPVIKDGPPTKMAVVKEAPTKKPLAKPAPYDFKARYNLLLEKHNSMKSEFDAMKVECDVIKNDATKFKDAFAQLQLKIKECEEQVQLISDLKVQIQTNHQLYERSSKMLLEVQEEKNLLENEKAELMTTFSEIKTENKQLITTNQGLKDRVDENDKLIKYLTEKMQNSDVERRRLHNTIQDLKGNIRVFCRVRPTLKGEACKQLIQLQYKDETTLEVCTETSSCTNNRRNTQHNFTFDRVFKDDSTQEELFVELSQLVESALDGYNVCVFAYGQTGSGKTYTMEGGETTSSLGMIPRTVDLIFKSIKAKHVIGWRFQVEVSFLEIYNEQIIDLLSDQKKQQKYEIKMKDASGKDVFVLNQKIVKIESEGELMTLLRQAQRNRTIAATEMNAHSSRSHFVAKIQLYANNLITSETLTGSISLVDLAGSERARDSEAVRLTETKNINKSLANLSNVILALLDKQEHIPYRNSKLTHLLMPSLGGNSKTLMIVNISPVAEFLNESLNSLKFASKVNVCKTGDVKQNKNMQKID